MSDVVIFILIIFVMLLWLEVLELRRRTAYLSSLAQAQHTHQKAQAQFIETQYSVVKDLVEHVYGKRN